MLTKQALLDANFVPLVQVARSAGQLFQKWISDDRGVRYPLTIRWIVRRDREVFVPFVQFTCSTGDKRRVFNVEMSRNDETVSEIEKFYARVWNSMGADYYHANGLQYVPQDAVHSA